MIILFLLLLYSRTIFEVQSADVCVVRIQDGHSNEEDSITHAHCELYDLLHHNGTSTLRVIDIDGTVAGCWLFEGETFYYNSNLNPSGMCSVPHYCIQYADCATSNAEGLETLIQTNATNAGGGITTAAATPTAALTASLRPEPAFPSHDIIKYSTIVLVIILAIIGYLLIRTNHRVRLTYPP